MKKRKPRTKSIPLDFDGAHQFGQPIHMNYNSPAVNKLSERLNQNLCLGCGKKKCECKSKKL